MWFVLPPWALLDLNGALIAPDLQLGSVQHTRLKSPAAILPGRGSPEGSFVLVFPAPPAVSSVFSPACMVATNPLLPTFNPSCYMERLKNGTEPWTRSQELCALNPALPLAYGGILSQTFSPSGFSLPTHKSRVLVNLASNGPLGSNVLRSQGGFPLQVAIILTSRT